MASVARVDKYVMLGRAAVTNTIDYLKCIHEGAACWEILAHDDFYLRGPGAITDDNDQECQNATSFCNMWKKECVPDDECECV